MRTGSEVVTLLHGWEGKGRKTQQSIRTHKPKGRALGVVNLLLTIGSRTALWHCCEWCGAWWRVNQDTQPRATGTCAEEHSESKSPINRYGGWTSSEQLCVGHQVCMLQCLCLFALISICSVSYSHVNMPLANQKRCVDDVWFWDICIVDNWGEPERAPH